MSLANPFSKKAFTDPLGLFKKDKNTQADAINNTAVPLPAKPAQPTNDAVIQAEQDVAQQNLLKKSVKKTILAGDTGGWRPDMGGKPMGS